MLSSPAVQYLTHFKTLFFKYLLNICLYEKLSFAWEKGKRRGCAHLLPCHNLALTPNITSITQQNRGFRVTRIPTPYCPSRTNSDLILAITCYSSSVPFRGLFLSPLAQRVSDLPHQLLSVCISKAFQTHATISEKRDFSGNNVVPGYILLSLIEGAPMELLQACSGV